ncbi:MAG TPA: hypothetical protein GXX75_04980 [Clostridiales bacterium]|nr:hypothetical protein [Clostridiales bacterium]
MDGQIYDILNRVNTNLEEYEEIKLSDYQNKINSKRILSKIDGKQQRTMKPWNIGKKIAVAGIIAALGMASATTVSFASEGKIFNSLYSFLNGSRITNEYDEKTGMGKATIEMNATENPPVELDNGRIYFVADGNKTDITDQLTAGLPYIGEYLDEQNIIHKFIIGGRPVEDGYGYEENLFDSKGKFLGASGYFGSKVEGIDGENEPEWLLKGRSEIGRSE